MDVLTQQIVQMQMQIPDFHEARRAYRDQQIKEYLKDQTADFKQACTWYTTAMLEAIKQALPIVIKTGEAWVHVGRICWSGYEGQFKKYPFHVIHYGLQPVHTDGTRATGWTERDLETWTKMGVEHPFKALQKLLLAKGYLLRDLSYEQKKETDKVRFSFQIRPVGKIMDIESKRWHGLDVLPSDIFEDEEPYEDDEEPYEEGVPPMDCQYDGFDEPIEQDKYDGDVPLVRSHYDRHIEQDEQIKLTPEFLAQQAMLTQVQEEHGCADEHIE